MPRVDRSDAARRDLKQTARHLAEVSGSRAVALRWLDAIAERCQLYAVENELGEACPDLGAQVRRFSFGAYVVYYRPSSQGIELLRILHGRRDVSGAWFGQR